MKVKFDECKFIEDMRRVVNDAKTCTPSLVVVPTEREVRTFERNFKADLDGIDVFCCSFADYYNSSWMTMFSPRPKVIFGFRDDDVWNNASADAEVRYVTIKSYRRKKEEIKNEEA